ncbi:hypothetical protein STAS_19720 [Striga asiatica]|uniref:Uncharacterized protein n=1 Tax=Striga asiatica TaxID=4170 RepID=A0A5A7QD96_STRAF|nr:hypothetical protein STAS_19720 [Striga asiatica]
MRAFEPNLEHLKFFYIFSEISYFSNLIIHILSLQSCKGKPSISQRVADILPAGGSELIIFHSCTGVHDPIFFPTKNPTSIDSFDIIMMKMKTSNPIFLKPVPGGEVLMIKPAGPDQRKQCKKTQLPSTYTTGFRSSEVGSKLGVPLHLQIIDGNVRGPSLDCKPQTLGPHGWRLMRER